MDLQQKSTVSLEDDGAAAKPVSKVDSRDLLGERGELKIVHNGEWYSLRRTRQGRLILTK